MSYRELQPQMLNLQKEGCSYGEIAQRLGISRGSVEYWINPARRKAIRAQSRTDRQKPDVRERERERNRRRVAYNSRAGEKHRKEARAALKKVRAEENASRVGGLSEAYSLLRRCVQVADQALGELEIPESREELRSAITHLHKAEDQLATAGRLG